MSMTAISIKQTNEKSHVTNAGPTIVATFKVSFCGSFSTSYIYQHAGAMGLVDYGTNIEAEITANSLFVATTSAPGSFSYTTTFSTINAERLDLSPLSRPAVIKGGGIDLTEVRRVDVNGDAIVNSVGDFYEDLPCFYVPGGESTISWNVADNPADLAQEFSFTTNSGSIWGQDAYSGIIRKITYENVYEVYQGALIEFWRVTVPLTFRNDGLGWGFQPLDYGYRYDNGSTVQNYKDPITQVFGPVFLDGSGGLLNGNGTTNGSDPVIYPDGDPAGYETLVSVDWSGLGVPVSPFA